MNLDVNTFLHKMTKNDFAINFMNELCKEIKCQNNKNGVVLENDEMDNMPLNPKEGLNLESDEMDNTQLNPKEELNLESDEMDNTQLNPKEELDLESDEMNNMHLTPKEELAFDRKEFAFLQEYFEKELSNLSNGEIFIVTNKYDNDIKYHRYKVAQYKNNLECKYIAFEKDLPPNVQLCDVVRKVNGKFIYDGQATRVCEGLFKQN